MIRTLEESRDFFAADRFAMEACGITIDEVTQQGARCSMPLTPMHLNAGGVAQGGAVYTLCDTTFAVAANAGGVMMFDAKYADVKEITTKPYIVDDKTWIGKIYDQLVYAVVHFVIYKIYLS